MYTEEDIEAYFGDADPGHIMKDKTILEAAKEYCDSFPDMFGVCATVYDRKKVLEILYDYDREVKKGG
jgi:hypothetical protein